MSDNRVAQLIQQLDDAIMMGDDDLIEQIRSDLFREYGIERSGRTEMGLGGLIGKAIGNAVNTMIKQKKSPIGRTRGSKSTQSKFYDDFDDVDVTIVIGASDTVSSAAEDDPNRSIYGMPVLRVWKSKAVFVSKRTIGNTGYAGMENPILFKDNVEVVLGDAHDTCEALKTAL